MYRKRIDNVIFFPGVSLVANKPRKPEAIPKRCRIAGVRKMPRPFSRWRVRLVRSPLHSSRWRSIQG